MRALPWLISLCLLACAGEDPPAVAESYAYLLTPGGQRFRVIASGPLLRGADSGPGLRIKYIAEAATSDELLAAADSLVAALGPELQLTGDPNLVVRAQLDATGTRFYDVEYRLEASGFLRVQQDPSANTAAAANSEDDHVFPYRAALLDEAGEAGAGWLLSLDRDDMPATRAELGENFREQISDDARLGELILQRRHLGLPGVRRELYRMQRRIAGRNPGDDVLVVYECSMPLRPRVLERLSMSRDADVWRVSGYVFQPLL